MVGRSHSMTAAAATGVPLARTVRSIRETRGMEIRARESGDLPALVALTARVRRVDGYPVYLPNDDYQRFLSQPAALTAFVAIQDGAVIGHVAVTSSTSRAAMQVFDSVCAGCDLGVVARLLVDPSARRAGYARALLRMATTAARADGRVPVLDVVSSSQAAIALYRSEGWSEIGEIDLELPELFGVRELLFVHRSADEHRPRHARERSR